MFLLSSHQKDLRKNFPGFCFFSLASCEVQKKGMQEKTGKEMGFFISLENGAKMTQAGKIWFLSSSPTRPLILAYIFSNPNLKLN